MDIASLSGKDPGEQRLALSRAGVVVCKACPLRGRPIAPGFGPYNTGLMLLGEGPGKEEARKGAPFVGKAGAELDGYMKRAGLRRDAFYVTNCVKCHPPGDRDPTAEELACCFGWLALELATVRPEVLGTLGAVATKTMLADRIEVEPAMEMVHGKHYQIDAQTLVVPTYHPAYGLHDTRQMALIEQDFRSLGRAVRGEGEADPARAWGHDLNLPPPDYREMEDETALAIRLESVLQRPVGERRIAIDTETLADGSPWCLSFSVDNRHAWMVPADRPDLLTIVDDFVGNCNNNVLTILHNALFDLGVLEQMNVQPALWHDTMVMAYLLQDLPQGLKPLSYRLLGSVMTKYQDMIDEAGRDLALSYMVRALASREWPDPEPVLEKKPDGTPHVRQPQNISRKISKALGDWEKDESVDLRKRWAKMEGTEVVEAVLGPMPQADLSYIDRNEAVDYACEDALNTYRLHPLLLREIEEKKLVGTMIRDLSAMHMVDDMQRFGMPLSVERLHELGAEFDEEMERINLEIDLLAGFRINPASPPQVLKFLHSTGIRPRSTENATLEAIGTTATKLIVEWREAQKMRTSFVNVLLEKRGEDDRIRADLRTTRVITGRISASNPNLMAIPVRTERGRKIRSAFVASPGHVLTSADYSQVEMRVTAHCSQDVEMINVFNSDQDIHAVTASKAFGVPISQLDEMKHRYPAKRVGFGVLNAVSAQGLLRELTTYGATGWDLQSCQEFIDEWFKIYAGVAKWLSGLRAQARRFGYVTDMFGRRRLIPEIRSAHRYIQADGLRAACNAPIQMGAQGVIKQAMGKLVPVYRRYRARPLMQIHDDLIHEARDDDLLDEFIGEKVYIMENCVQLAVPLKVDPKVGQSWATMKDYEIKGT